MLPNLRRYAVALCRNVADADDLVQSAILQALTHDQSALAAVRLDIWMYRIIKNLWLNQRRRAAVSRPHQSFDDMPDMPGSDGRAVVEARSDCVHVQRIFDQMKPEIRETSVLVLVNELTYQETAEVLATPIGTVMSRVSRARALLIENLPGAVKRGLKTL